MTGGSRDGISCDVAVIGAGTAGLAAWDAATREGARAALIERGPGGTTCARVGCMPSKLLIAAARAAHEARGAGLFGIEVPQVGVDGRAVMRRLRAERDRFVATIRAGLGRVPEDLRVAGEARFTGPATLLVDGRVEVRANAVVIATGSSPSLPPSLAGVAGRVLTTDTLFESEDLPDSLAVLGAGPVGIEIAQAMTRLGVRVTVFDPAQTIGGAADPAVAASAEAIIGREVDLRLRTEVTQASPDGEGIRLHWRSGGETGSAAFARVLAAAGRPPNLADLDLGRAGLDLDASGRPEIHPHSLQCGQAPLFIAGDANRLRPVLHEASRQGRIAGRNAARFPRVEAPAPWPAFALVFTDPEMAAVGCAFDPEAARDWLIGEVSFADQGRARVMGRNAGLARIYAQPDGRLIGAEMVGPGVEHLAHLLAAAIQEGWTARRLLDRPYYHPTLEEGLTTALGALASREATPEPPRVSSPRAIR
ncbi:MAG: dihydrolipoyl dehydrogenase [Methylobacterium sp.]|uniref:dihydrolipoyl dehydrogenase n=1 Tax=Methylobacterium sp. TaxID=409 RepID=UPI0025889D1E|nr:dihydrolipoyl dehydrogenase [Methylobacterium sp.]MBY0296546.1 dihydrolipoyl dehydrogenase [Methylobacterium sp.]